MPASAMLANVIMRDIIVIDKVTRDGRVASETRRSEGHFTQHLHSRRPPAILKAALWHLFLVPLSLLLAFAGTSEEKAVAIRALLQTPPTLAHYVYRRDLHGDMAIGNPPPMFIRGRWKSESVAWAQNLGFDRPSPADSRNLFRGQLGTLYWDAARGILTVYSSDLNRGKTDNPLCYMGFTAQLDARLILRLGLPEIDFNRAKWTGEAFSARLVRNERTPMETSVEVVGQLTEGAPGQFEILLTNLQTGTLESKVILAYSEPAIPEPFPTTIEQYKRMGADIQHVATIRIFDVVPGETEMDDTMFDPMKMPEVARSTYSYFSNSVQYASIPGRTNQFRRVLTPDEAMRAARRSYTKPILLSALALGMAIALTWVALKTRRENINANRNTASPQ